MPSFDLGTHPTTARTAALVHALARAEAAGHRTARLTEPGLDTWRRFRGRLTSVDFLELLFEDAAVLHRIPFDHKSLDIDPPRLPEDLAEAWLKQLPTWSLGSDPAVYLQDQARLLGLPTRMARSELHIVKPHQRVLELPGTGGQLAFHLVSTQDDLTLHENFTLACDGWQELTLAGVVALAFNAPHAHFIRSVRAEALRPPHELTQASFDFVIGLHPDKGGLFRAEDQLNVWFPSARIVLV